MGDFNTDAVHDKSSYQKIINQGLFDSYVLAKEKTMELRFIKISAVGKILEKKKDWTIFS